MCAEEMSGVVAVVPYQSVNSKTSIRKHATREVFVIFVVYYTVVFLLHGVHFCFQTRKNCTFMLKSQSVTCLTFVCFFTTLTTVTIEISFSFFLSEEFPGYV